MDVKETVRQMTLGEKAAMCSGADFWHTQEIKRLGIPSSMVSDGPHGLRKQPEESDGDHLGLHGAIAAVCFPAACATACSFDRDLMYDMGETLGKECQAEGVSVLLGPAVNIKRSPLCGRNFEYMSEDPYLAGELAAAYIKGVQSRNVGTSIKHFAANNQEHERMSTSADMDERTLREIYLPAFEKAVKEAQPWTVMCSYNRVNGEYASENKRLLTNILRDEWGFEGYVMSDWGAVRDRVKGLAAGLDLEMPGCGGANDRQIIEAVKSGKLSEETLDQAVERILNIVFRFTENRQKESFDRETDHRKSAETAKKCIVLLKNENEVLPLKRTDKIAMIGGFAKIPRYQGGGSSHINSYKVVSALSLKDSYGNITFAEGFPADRDRTDEKMVNEALKIAEKADKILVFAGLPDSFESESYDRNHMRLPDCQNVLIRRLMETGKPVIVVLHNGSPVEMPWAEQAQGIVEAYLGGEAVAEAVMDILYGKCSPSGKLAETFPMRLEDNPSFLNFPGMNKHVNYAEGIFVGYRYYDKKKMDVLFPFGHGLSYTEFSYDNLSLSDTEISPDGKLMVSVDVTNTGKMTGREIVQLYVSDRTGVAVRPESELKGFASVTLKPGEKKTVTMELDYRSFAWYDTVRKGWHAAGGRYWIRIGKSSRNIVLDAEVTMKNSSSFIPVIDENVMLGDLLNCDKTRHFTEQKLMQYVAQFIGSDSLDEMDEMEKKMVWYLPLSSLRSFASLNNEDIKAIVEELKKAAYARLRKTYS